RPSRATLTAAQEHAELEAAVGAYVAEQQADPVVAEGRAALAGLLGVPPSGLAFTESGTASLALLLRVWPLSPGDTVAVVPSEWGPNLAAFADAGLEVTQLDVDGDGVVDLDALERRLRTDPPAAVHLTQVASHRALVQPVAEALAVCRRAGVPLWVDAAQALGHVDTATGADAVYSTSRKWLAGPRGVGMLGFAEPWWERLRVPAAARALPPARTPVQALESREAHVAGRVGLAVAVRQHLDADPAGVHRGLAQVGRRTRKALAGLPGWQVVDAVEAPTAVTALRSTGPEDVPTAAARLAAEHRILTTAGAAARAPGEMRGPLLRISPHLDLTDGDLERLRAALA
ncbi:MAG TPA: aminotransferase class V-fold PLP-dependent enzyme, partial [Kineosporiaceae bacterium]|nr:aminotransferase class V-fold PLP-dependent enzyme [Kineosporiaceae bacterium]